MRRRKLIKATAWINAAIIVLGTYAAKATDNVIFSICAVTYAMTWLLAFIWANLPTDEKARPTDWNAGRAVRKVSKALEHVRTSILTHAAVNDK